MNQKELFDYTMDKYSKKILEELEEYNSLKEKDDWDKEHKFGNIFCTIRSFVERSLQELDPYEHFQYEDRNIIRRRNDLIYLVVEDIGTNIYGQKEWDNVEKWYCKSGHSLTGNDAVNHARGVGYFKCSLNTRYADPWNENEMDR